MNLIFFDDIASQNLLPLTLTRPMCEIRVGILTIREKWEKYFNGNFSYLTSPHLSKKFPCQLSTENIFINGSVIPDKSLVDAIKEMDNNSNLVCNNTLIAAKLDLPLAKNFSIQSPASKSLEYPCTIFKINNSWDIFSQNSKAIADDFQLLTQGRKSAKLSETNRVLNPSNVFIEEGAVVECATINAQTGPVYIGSHAEIMEGSIVRGPFALCEHSTLKMGAKIYGPTTIGPYSKVGGEVNNSVIFGYSNKAHDGFLGNSVIGEWCNLGADTNNSNLKNNYAEVKLWSYTQKSFVKTGLQFCGLIMGDHSKCGINTMFNTGTVVGVSANIFGDGFPRNFIPSFSWGGAQGFTEYKVDKAIETAEKVYERRGMVFNETEKEIFRYLSENEK